METQAVYQQLYGRTKIRRINRQIDRTETGVMGGVGGNGGTGHGALNRADVAHTSDGQVVAAP